MFDPTKPVQTRDGRKARIICTDRKGELPIVALIGDDEARLMFYTSMGLFFENDVSRNDLINIPEKRKMTVWVRAITDGTQSDYASSDKPPEFSVYFKSIPVEIEYEV